MSLIFISIYQSGKKKQTYTSKVLGLHQAKGDDGETWNSGEPS